MTIPDYSGCVWPADPACYDDQWNNLDLNVRARALALASSALSGLVAYRVGECPVTVRPCAPRCCGRGFVPYQGNASWISPGIGVSGQWINACGHASCGCSAAQEITLPRPVGRVQEVRINGTSVSLSNFRLDNGNILVRVDGGTFPVAQDLSLPDTSPETFSITYLNAYPVDSLGAQAVAYLAMEFAKACVPKGKCSLPRGVINVIRNGISFEIQAGLFPNGLTNIDIVDAYIMLWNPNGRKQQSRVWYPRSPVRTTSAGNFLPIPSGTVLDGGPP